MDRISTLNLDKLVPYAVGFDKMFSDMQHQFSNSTKAVNFPPYNMIQINENEYMISLAVAGFSMDNLDITLDDNVLRIEGTSPKGDETTTYMHRGIGARNFRRQFTLAEYIEVSNASLDLGMLNIHLVRNVPEQNKPRKIAIATVV